MSVSNSEKSIEQKTTSIIRELVKKDIKIAEKNGVKYPLPPSPCDPKQQTKICKGTKLAEETIDKIKTPLKKAETTVLTTKIEDNKTIHTLNSNPTEAVKKSTAAFKVAFDFPAASSIGGSTSEPTAAANAAKDAADLAATQAAAVFEGASLTKISSELPLARGKKQILNCFPGSNIPKIPKELGDFPISTLFNCNLTDKVPLNGFKKIITQMGAKMTDSTLFSFVDKNLSKQVVKDATTAFAALKTLAKTFVPNPDGEDPNDDGFT